MREGNRVVDLLRIYLLAGIVAHKAYWEFTKRRVPAPPKTSPSLAVRLRQAVVDVLYLLLRLDHCR